LPVGDANRGADGASDDPLSVSSASRG